MKIIEALPQSVSADADVGKVVILPDGSAGIGTGKGILKIVTLQMEGKKPMSSVEFLRGQRQFAGSVLPS
jgi:methionyl-tRNA formyltransferase